MQVRELKAQERHPSCLLTSAYSWGAGLMAIDGKRKGLLALPMDWWSVRMGK